MTSKLPILISIPHGGEIIPPEVIDRVSINHRDVFFDGDALTRRIYNFRDNVEAFIETPIARAILDVNRAPDDRAPKNPDGVVKTVTTDKTLVYKDDMFPDDNLIEELLAKYYFPFHKKIDEALDSGKIQLALDCHSMLEKAPPIGPEPGKPRPLICLSNGGDEKGRPLGSDAIVTCPPETMQSMAKSFKEVFSQHGDIKINEPFKGGYNARLHFKNKNVPWIQIEINRRLYLNNNWFDERTLIVKNEKIIELRNMILNVILRFW